MPTSFLRHLVAFLYALLTGRVMTVNLHGHPASLNPRTLRVLPPLMGGDGTDEEDDDETLPSCTAGASRTSGPRGRRTVAGVPRCRPTARATPT